jgi:hypothetical protein
MESPTGRLLSGRRCPLLVAKTNSHGIDWILELETDGLLPGRLARARVQLTAHHAVNARGLLATLIGTEKWQYAQSQPRAGGGFETRTVTDEDSTRVPVQLAGAVVLSDGATRSFDLDIPVPPLGPASLDATVSSMAWELEVKLDQPGWMDSAIVVPVRVLQPTALLRAGVVHVGQFALYPAADAQTDGARASIELDPMPLCLGAPFSGSLTIETTEPTRVKEVRFELRVHVESTVNSGREEDMTIFVGQVAGEGELQAGTEVIPFRAELPRMDLPTIELPHGRAQATVHVILARAWAPDPHLVRDVALCTTTEI